MVIIYLFWLPLAVSIEIKKNHQNVSKLFKIGVYCINGSTYKTYQRFI